MKLYYIDYHDTQFKVAAKKISRVFNEGVFLVEMYDDSNSLVACFLNPRSVRLA